MTDPHRLPPGEAAAFAEAVLLVARPAAPGARALLLGADGWGAGAALAGRLLAAGAREAAAAPGPDDPAATGGAPWDLVVMMGGPGPGEDARALCAALARLAGGRGAVVAASLNEPYLLGRGPGLDALGRPSLSFFDLRTAAEDALGPGRWLHATLGQGVALWDEAGLRGGAAEGAAADGPLAAVDGGGAPPLRPSTALGWAGLWRLPGAPALAAALYPAGADHRARALPLVSPSVAVGRRRRLAVVVDQPDWAFANIVSSIAPHLEGRYEVTRFVVSEFENRDDVLRRVFAENEFDNVHVMWREMLFSHLDSAATLDHVMRATGLGPAELARRLARPVLTTSVYDHLFLRPEDLDARAVAFSLVDAYAVSSGRLMEAYGAAHARGLLPLPAAETPDAVDFARFAPSRAAQALRGPARADPDSTLVIGWVGNSHWAKGNGSLAEDAKGFHTILAPAVERLAAEGLPVALHVADRSLRARTRDEMVAYYGEIDLLACASSHEGTPNPVLEAMAAGLAFVSTDVGIVREVSGPLQHGLILPERSVDAMAAALRALLLDRPRLAALAAENLRLIEGWTWAARAPDWLRLLAEGERAHARGSGARRRGVMEARLRAAAASMAAPPGGAAAPDAQVRRLRELVKGLEKQNAELQRAERAARLDAERLQGAVGEQDRAIGEMRALDRAAAAELARLADAMAAKDELLAAKDADLVELRRMDAAARAELDRLYAELGARDRDLGALRGSEAEARAEAERLRRLLRSRRRSLAHLLRGRGEA